MPPLIIPSYDTDNPVGSRLPQLMQDEITGLIAAKVPQAKTHLTAQGWWEGPDYMALPKYPGLVTVGDSFMGNNYVRSIWNGSSFSRTASFTGFGMLNQALIYADQPVTSWTLGVGGRTAAQVLAGFDIEVPQYQPQIVMIHAGTNDIATSRTAAAIFADLMAIVEKAWKLGAKVILCNVPPRVGLTSTQIKEIHKVNLLLAGIAGINPQNLVVVDEYSLFADPLTELFRTGYSIDGIHPNSKACLAFAKLLKPVLDRFAQNKTTVLGLGGANDSTNMLSAVSMLPGTSGTKIANKGLTGNLADGLFALSTGTDANMAAVISKVAASDGYGFWQQVTINTVPSANDTVTLLMTASAGFAAGDVVQPSVRFETDASGWGNGLLDMTVMAYDGTPTYLYVSSANAASTDAVIQDRPERGILTAPAFVVPPNTTTLQMSIVIGNTGTARFGRPSIRKLTKVSA